MAKLKKYLLLNRSGDIFQRNSFLRHEAPLIKAAWQKLLVTKFEPSEESKKEKNRTCFENNLLEKHFIFNQFWFQKTFDELTKL